MNRADFMNMMEETVPLNRASMGEVYELIDIFPYFQSAHLVLLKNLQNNGDVKFENQLRNSAIHIADREVLYYLLNRKSSSTAVRNENIPEKNMKSEALSDTEQTVIESGKNSKDLISEIERNSPGPKPDEDQDMAVQTRGHSVLIASEADSEEPAGVIMLLEEEPLPDDPKVFFMDPGFSASDQSELLELDLDNDEPGSEEDSYVEYSGLHDTDEGSKKLLQSDLIDKFIFANPRIEPNREKTSLPVEDISQPSTEENGTFVTETLAKIYITQGYYSKAIDIFEKLSLKFPEKSSYFASQIEKVKEHIKK